MAQYKGDDLILYAYEDLEPIGCEDSFTLTISANEIITTTKGSGRATNREYGSYDWNVQCTGVITLNEAGKASPLHFNDNIIKGKKVAIKATIGEEFYFGLGIITTATNTGTSGEFAKFDVTIAGDGILYSTNDLKNTESEPTFLSFTPQNYTSSLLYNAKLLMLFADDSYVAPSANTYSFDEDNGSNQGVITFNNTYLIFIQATVSKIKVYYVPA